MTLSSIPTTLLAPWITVQDWNHQQWFTKVLHLILTNEFLPDDTGPITIASGRILSFSKSDLYIDIRPRLSTHEYGYRPGIILMNEALNRELAFTVNTPIEVIRLAIETLANEE